MTAAGPSSSVGPQAVCPIRSLKYKKDTKRENLETIALRQFFKKIKLINSKGHLPVENLYGGKNKKYCQRINFASTFRFLKKL